MTGPTPTLKRDGDLFVLDLGAGENRLNPDSISALGALAEEAAAADPPRALITTGSGRFFSTGLDLEWIAENPDDAGQLVDGLHDLLARWLELPITTIAAIRGHAFAGGALLALAHDQRIVRADRGYFCLPEVDLRLPFTSGMAAFVGAKVGPRTAHEAMTTGRRYSGPDAVEAGIADAAAEGEVVLVTAKERAASLADKDPYTLGLIKGRTYASVLATLRDRESNRVDPERFAYPLATLASSE